MPEGDVAPVGVGVLIGDQLLFREVHVGRGDDLHDVFVRLQSVPVELVPPAQRVERPDAFLTDLPDLGAEGDFVDVVGEVVFVGLLVNGMRGNVEISRDLRN